MPHILFKGFNPVLFFLTDTEFWRWAEFTHDLSDAQRYPYHVLILREPYRMRFDYLQDSLLPLRMQRKHTLPTGSFFADTVITRILMGKKFLSSFLLSMCTCSHNFTNFAVTKSLHFLRCSALVARNHLLSLSFSLDIYANSLGERTSAGNFLIILKAFINTFKVKEILQI